MTGSTITSNTTVDPSCSLEALDVDGKLTLSNSESSLSDASSQLIVTHDSTFNMIGGSLTSSTILEGKELTVTGMFSSAAVYLSAGSSISTSIDREDVVITQQLSMGAGAVLSANTVVLGDNGDPITVAFEDSIVDFEHVQIAGSTTVTMNAATASSTLEDTSSNGNIFNVSALTTTEGHLTVTNGDIYVRSLNIHASSAIRSDVCLGCGFTDYQLTVPDETFIVPGLSLAHDMVRDTLVLQTGLCITGYQVTVSELQGDLDIDGGSLTSSVVDLNTVSTSNQCSITSDVSSMNTITITDGSELSLDCEGLSAVSVELDGKLHSVHPITITGQLSGGADGDLEAVDVVLVGTSVQMTRGGGDTMTAMSITVYDEVISQCQLSSTQLTVTDGASLASPLASSSNITVEGSGGVVGGIHLFGADCDHSFSDTNILHVNLFEVGSTCTTTLKALQVQTLHVEGHLTVQSPVALTNLTMFEHSSLTISADHSLTIAGHIVSTPEPSISVTTLVLNAATLDVGLLSGLAALNVKGIVRGEGCAIEAQTLGIEADAELHVASITVSSALLADGNSLKGALTMVLDDSTSSCDLTTDQTDGVMVFDHLTVECSLAIESTNSLHLHGLTIPADDIYSLYCEDIAITGIDSTAPALFEYDGGLETARFTLSDVIIQSTVDQQIDVDTLNIDGDVTADDLTIRIDEELVVDVEASMTLDSLYSINQDNTIAISGSITASNAITFTHFSSLTVSGSLKADEITVELGDTISSSIAFTSATGLAMSPEHFTVESGGSVLATAASLSLPSINLAGTLEVNQGRYGETALLNASSTLTISPDAKLVLLGPTSDGGLGEGEEDIGGGAGHIGEGSNPDGTMEHNTYKLASSALGSGGGGALMDLGGVGGGAVELISPVIDLSGSVRADGREGECVTRFNVPYCGGGGSGGSILLTGAISGQGVLTVAGGVAKHLQDVSGGAGGGGIIMLREGATVDGSTVTVLIGGGTGILTTPPGGDGAVQVPDNLCDGIYSLRVGTLSCQWTLWFRVVVFGASGVLFAGLLYVVLRVVRHVRHGSVLYNVNSLESAKISGQFHAVDLRLGTELAEDVDIFEHFQALRVDPKALEVQGLLGQGGFGQVYRGRYNDSEVCVKRVPVDMRDKKQRRTVMRECMALARLRHPNVLRLYGLHFTEQEVLILTELASHGSLDSIVSEYFQRNKRHRVPGNAYVAIILRLHSQIADALSHLHSQHPPMVHRDIKPANILLRDRKTAVLADFGISRAVTDFDATMTATIMGSPAYMPPEAVRGRLGVSADVYSIGCSLYECLTHRTPFEGIQNALLVVRALTSGQKPSDLLEPVFTSHPRVAALLSLCWRSDPHSRPSAASVSNHLVVLAKELDAPKPSNK